MPLRSLGWPKLPAAFLKPEDKHRCLLFLPAAWSAVLFFFQWEAEKEAFCVFHLRSGQI